MTRSDPKPQVCGDLQVIRELTASRRRELGCFMTPWPIARLMAHQLVSRLDPDGTVIDPAAGTGRLLTCVAEELASRGRNMQSADGIVGVEIQPSVARWTNLHLQQLLNTQHPVCTTADSLHLLEPSRRREILGTEFFSGVIANPPYVREKHNRRIFRQLLREIPKWNRYFGPRQDLQQLFLIFGLHLLKPGGHLVFLVNPYWLHSDSGQTVRRLLVERAELVSLIDFGELRLFPEAKGQHSLLVHFRDRRVVSTQGDSPNLLRVRSQPPGGLSELCRTIEEVLNGGPSPDYLDLFDGAEMLARGPKRRWYLPSPRDALISRLESASVPLGRVFKTHQGVISGADRVSRYNRSWVSETIPLDTGIFLLTKEELSALNLSDFEIEVVRPIYRARHIQPFAIVSEESSGCFILYLQRGATLKGCPRIRRHLEQFRPLLQRRREVRADKIAWYQLQWPRNPELFTRPRLVTPRRSQKPRFAMGRRDHCEQSDIAMITSPDDSISRLAALMVVLNSDLIGWWSKYRGKQKGLVREFFGRALEEIPIPAAVLEQPRVFEELARYAQGNDREEANRLVAQLFRC